jgi:hypothetical protein
MVMPHALHVVLKPIFLGPYLDLMCGPTTTATDRSLTHFQ